VKAGESTNEEKEDGGGKEANTSPKIFINLKGTEGETGDRLLNTNADKLTKNTVTINSR